MSKTVKKNISEQALLDYDAIKQVIKEQSKSTIKDLLADTIKDAIRESVEDEDEPEYDVLDQDPDVDDASDAKNDSDADDSKDSTAEDDVDDTEDSDSDEEAAVDDAEEGKAGEASDNEDDGDTDALDGFEDYKTEDGVYDLTSEKDYDKVLKIFKLMSDDDPVIVKKDGDKIKMDNKESGDEYIIDLGTDNSDSDDSSECKGNDCVNESSEDIAGLPSTDDDFDFEFKTDDDLEFDNDETNSELDDDSSDLEFESKNNCKPMDEAKDTVFEIDLGYTDNYQSKDPVSGLSNHEPSKSGRNIDKGVPTGTTKPWAGKAIDKGQPFEDKVNENSEEMVDEPEVTEGTNVGGAVQQRSNSKSHIPANRKNYGPKVKRHVSAGGEYHEMIEAYKREKKLNKALKECILKLRDGLQEARVTNFNLAKITKLIVENTVSQQEKVNIVNRFTNEAKTIEQSKALYESIKNDLNKKVIPESKQADVQAETSTNLLNEETQAFAKAELMKTLDLIKRVENC